MVHAPSRQSSHTAGNTSYPWFSILEEWRGVACLLVVFFHTGFNLRLGPIVILGNCGVELFFVLSGYLISRQFFGSLIEMKPLPSTGKFFRRRFMRLYPAYLVVLLAVILARWMAHRTLIDFPNVLSHFILLFNYGPPERFFSLNVTFWSLAIEIQFYLMVPLAFQMARRFLSASPRLGSWCVILSFMACGPLARLMELRWFPDAIPLRGLTAGPRSVFSFLDLFSYGMSVAFLEKSGVLARVRRDVIVLTGLFGLVLALLVMRWSDQAGTSIRDGSVYPLLAVGYESVLCAGFGMILAAVVHGRDTGNGSRWSPFAWTGKISYSLYLVHVPIQFAVMKLIPDLATLGKYGYQTYTFLLGLITLPPVLLGAWILYETVEKPYLEARQ